jgi:hypothetical protein
MGSRAFAAMLKVGPALNRAVAVERDVVVRAPDGARLLTDVYLAEPRRPLPVTLPRSPYGRRGPFGAMARLFAERGYTRFRQDLAPAFGHLPLINADTAALGHPPATRDRANPWRPRKPCTPRCSPSITPPAAPRPSCCPSPGSHNQREQPPYVQHKGI